MSSTNFNFTDTTEPTIESLSEDSDSVAEWREGHVGVTLSAKVIDYVSTYGSQRNKSNGGTHVRRDSESSDEGIQVHGVKGEAALHIAYDEFQFDDEIYDDSGDGGIDGKMYLDGEMRTVDVKTTRNNPPWIKIEAGAIEKKSEDERADAYVAAYAEGDTVLFYGWLPSEDVIQQSNKRTSYAGDHKNYVREGGFNPMPSLTVRCNQESERFSLLSAASEQED